jgi:hypothetical protein
MSEILSDRRSTITPIAEEELTLENASISNTSSQIITDEIPRCNICNYVSNFINSCIDAIMLSF